MLQVELEECVSAPLNRSLRARRRNTVNAYAQKQQEFKAWCDTCWFDSGYQVTVAKLNLFSMTKFSSVTTAMYVSAITDLYNVQHAMGINSAIHPRNAVVKALLGSLRREKYAKAKLEYVDRDIGTLLDGYCSADEQRMLAQQGSI
ncbi:TPA: hypothetical protein N0F65_005782 [Lagenidium giganteum]|uniref:Uncharacterized protein n=1 Tax=Lagenidium giganteum TaxID=4803 RepID=A0AAV2YU76_9STRA|nr:TPA: hypothetical protein N0F65_005782 [Lagenidium giganteum]